LARSDLDVVLAGEPGGGAAVLQAALLLGLRVSRCEHDFSNGQKMI
jgi:hypothetical protein